MLYMVAVLEIFGSHVNLQRFYFGMTSIRATRLKPISFMD